ncbi:hypothetical protein [Quadrisphaera sp. DSM 44207]|uniref:hypothetical protein n=1 Tax=Quadrisphaera sp. DSM 44207 TaxID=1881057 RepID=UPI000B89C4C3|nr:hypothetical protein [Quadrisphaera sp. DSM 44207]
MSDKAHPAQDQRETSSLSASRESKGAVVVTTTGLPVGYTPPSAALMPRSSAGDGGTAAGSGDAAAAGNSGD